MTKNDGKVRAGEMVVRKYVCWVCVTTLEKTEIADRPCSRDQVSKKLNRSPLERLRRALAACSPFQ